MLIRICFLALIHLDWPAGLVKLGNPHYIVSLFAVNDVGCLIDGRTVLVQWDNDAEMLVKDIVFQDDDTPLDRGMLGDV